MLAEVVFRSTVERRLNSLLPEWRIDETQHDEEAEEGLEQTRQLYEEEEVNNAMITLGPDRSPVKLQLHRHLSPHSPVRSDRPPHWVGSLHTWVSVKVTGATRKLGNMEDVDVGALDRILDHPVHHSPLLLRRDLGPRPDHLLKDGDTASRTLILIPKYRIVHQAKKATHLLLLMIRLYHPNHDLDHLRYRLFPAPEMGSLAIQAVGAISNRKTSQVLPLHLDRLFSCPMKIFLSDLSATEPIQSETFFGGQDVS